MKKSIYQVQTFKGGLYPRWTDYKRPMPMGKAMETADRFRSVGIKARIVA